MSNLQTIDLKGVTEVNGKQISNILIYENGEILFDFKRAEISPYKNRFSWEKISTLVVEEVKLAKKINLSRKDNFIIINKEHNYFRETRYDLYINSKDIRVENKREEIYMELDDRTDFIPVAELYFTHGARLFRRTKEGEELIEYNINNPLTAKEGHISRHELTPFGKMVEELVKKFEELRINMASYDIEKMLKHFDVVEKEV